MSDEADVLAQQLQRGGTAYVVQVLALLALPVSFVAMILTGNGWPMVAMGPAMAVAGIATLIARRTVVPAWSLSFVLSWVAEDALAHQRIMARVVGVSLIAAGLFWTGSMLYGALAFR